MNSIFKIGDKVRIRVRDEYTFFPRRFDEQVRILASVGGTQRVYEINIECYPIAYLVNGYWFSEDDLELVESA